MSNVELAQTDIAEWIASLLLPELWDRYCYLSYAQMAEVPELAEYADDLREAERDWYRAYKTRRTEVASARRPGSGFSAAPFLHSRLGSSDRPDHPSLP